MNTDSPTLSFVVEDWTHIAGRGWLAMTRLDRDLPGDDFSHITGQVVLINGQPRKVRGIDRFLTLGPRRAGESIGLLIEGEKPEPLTPDP